MHVILANFRENMYNKEWHNEDLLFYTKYLMFL